MMNPEFDKIIGADDEVQSDVYSLAAERLSTTPQILKRIFGFVGRLTRSLMGCRMARGYFLKVAHHFLKGLI